MATNILQLCLLFAAVMFLTIAGTKNVNEPAEMKTLYFLTIQSYPDPNATVQPSWEGAPDIIPAGELAVELINNRSDILQDYRLELINADGGCNIVTKTVISFVENVFTQQQKRPIVGIIGGSCSDSSIVLSPLSGREEVALINMHYGGSPLLGNRDLYPYAFGALGSSHVLVETIFTLMRRENWKRIAVLYDELRIFYSYAFNELRSTIAANIEGGEIAYASPVYDTLIPIQAIQRQLVRVIMIFTGPEFARRVMCLAYHKKMLYPIYQWFIFQRDFLEFRENVTFYYDNTLYNCSENLMVNTIMKGNFIIRSKLSTADNISITAAGITYPQYLQMYTRKVEEYNSNETNLYRPISVSIWAPIFFDQVWGLALALNNSNLNLTNYQHGMQEMTNAIREETCKLEFNGVSGRINFDNATGFSSRPADIFQVFDGQAVYVAYSDNGSIVNVSNPHFISDEFSSTYSTIFPGVAASFTVLTVILFCLIVLVHIVTIVYRKHNSIKASSPTLNQLIFTGCYVSVLAAVLEEIHYAIQLRGLAADAVCHIAIAWLIPIGYTLIFGTIAARTWRLYRIFTHYLEPGNLISNWVLFTFVFVLLTIDVVIATVWTAVDPIKHEFQSRVEENGAQGYKVVLVRYCTGSKHYFAWLGLVLGYKSLLLLVMVVLSQLTRHIYNRNFQTKSLRVLVYLLGMLFVLCVPLRIILVYRHADIHGSYSVFSFLLNMVVFLCFALVFLPPILPLVKAKFNAQCKNYNAIKAKCNAELTLPIL